MIIDSNGNVSDYSGGGGGTDYTIYLKHGWLMWAAWGVLGFIQVLSNRYLKVFWKFNRIVHIVSGTSIFIITMVMGLLAMKTSSWEIEKAWHTMMGFIILCAVGLVMLGGFFVGGMLYCSRWNTALVLKIKLGH